MHSYSFFIFLPPILTKFPPGKFVRTQNDNYEAVMEKLGVSWLLRKAAGASTPVMEISEAGGNWVIKTSTTMKTMELKFRYYPNYF